MKLAKVKIEYSSGTTIMDRVTLDPTTGQVHLAPRVHGLLCKMEESECSPSFTLEYMGYILPVTNVGGRYAVTIPAGPRAGWRQIVHAIKTPTKDQRQQNGRLLHTLSAASIVGAVGYAHSAASWDLLTAVNTIALAALGLVIWYCGYFNMKGE